MDDALTSDGHFWLDAGAEVKRHDGIPGKVRCTSVPLYYVDWEDGTEGWFYDRGQQGPEETPVLTPNLADESVEHSHHTIPTLVWLDIDEGIAALVALLNRVPGARTFSSCQGHRRSEVMSDAYVCFSHTKNWETFADRIDTLLTKANVRHDIIRFTSYGELRLNPDDIGGALLALVTL